MDNISQDKKYSIYKKIDKTLIIISYLTLAIPIMLLLVFWFKWFISIFCVTLLTIGMIIVFKRIKTLSFEEYNTIFNLKKIGMFIIFIVTINILSGAGGIGYQNWDYKGRNAILHDLIDYDWPVRYDYSELEYEANKIGSDKGFMSYYFAYWLPGAAIGKACGFTAANLFLLLEQTIITTLFFYLVIRKTKKISYKYILVFLCFGGLDIITRFIVNKWTGADVALFGESHIDTANGQFCMSTFITQLFWVFNQSIPAWIATMLMANEKSYENLGVLIALLLPFSPFPTIGLILLAIIIILFGFDFNELINLKRIKQLISIQNIFCVLSVIPIGLLFMQNSSDKGSVFIRAIQNGNLAHVLIGYILYIVLEFAIYSIIITKENRKKVLVYFALFAVLPTFYIGGGLDLGNRATIPVLVLFYIEIIKFIEHNEYKKRILALWTILIIASCTNMNELYRSIKNSYINWSTEHKLVYNDSYKTFGKFENVEVDAFIRNFVAPDKDNYFKKILR